MCGNVNVCRESKKWAKTSVDVSAFYLYRARAAADDTKTWTLVDYLRATYWPTSTSIPYNISNWSFEFKKNLIKLTVGLMTQWPMFFLILFLLFQYSLQVINYGIVFCVLRECILAIVTWRPSCVAAFSLSSFHFYPEKSGAFGTGSISVSSK